MASMKHDGLLALFHNRPSLAPELLQDALGFALPAWTEARVESAEFTQVVPTEYRADLVVLLLDGKPIFAIVVEVQLSRDEDKRKSWPLYLTSLRSRVGCPTVLMDRPWRPKYQKKRVPQRTLGAFGSAGSETGCFASQAVPAVFSGPTPGRGLGH
jgi:hypothetical protein